MSELSPSTTRMLEFKGHEERVQAVAVFPDRRRIVTGSYDKTVRLWDLETGVMLKKMEGHRKAVLAMALSRDGQLIASGDDEGVLVAWNGETGEPLTQSMKAHLHPLTALDFSPDGSVLASGSWDFTTKFWSTKTWKQQGNAIEGDGSYVHCIRYSPSGELLAIGTSDKITIYNSSTRERVASFKAHKGWNYLLAWTPNGTRLLSGGLDATVREWDALTWEEVGYPGWTGFTYNAGINAALAVDPTGTLVASSANTALHLWRLSDRQTIAIFQESAACVAFSLDGEYILSGSHYSDGTISQWAVGPKDTLQDNPYINGTIFLFIISLFLFGYSPINNLSRRLYFILHKGALPKDPPNRVTNDAQVSNSKTFSIDVIARNACIAGDLPTAEQLFTRDINTNSKNYASYANRSFVMARKHNWDRALQDAIMSINIQPSLTGYISKGIALYGKGHVRDARTAFDFASIFANEDSKIMLLLIKAIAIFNADQHEESIIFVQELAATCSNHDSLACRVVEAYLRVQLGINATNDARHSHAADHFTAAIKSSGLSSASATHHVCEDFVVLFGWDLKSLWQNAHQKRCDALRQAGRLVEALNSYRDMRDKMDNNTKASCLDWSNAFKEECSTLCLVDGEAAFAAGSYDTAINIYSAVINVNSASDAVFANRCKAKLGKMLWTEALLDAQKVIQLNPSSHVGYKLKLAALQGARRYDEAITAFRMMFARLESAHDVEMQTLRRQYESPSESEGVIRRAVDQQLDTAPLRLLNTATGLLYDREAQINAFKSSAEHNELWLSWSMKRADLRMEHITEAVATYFRYVVLSHRWEGKEPLLQDIQGKVVYKLNLPSGIVKLRKFCEIARDSGYHWAWSDTCCIDKSSNVELQQSLNSMFVWYQHSALTVVYLSDVPPSSKPGALTKSEWNRRGWTFQEFLASKVVIFYQKNWTPYLNDRSPNHKKSIAIMEELEAATGIDRQALVDFSPGMSDTRVRLQWASNRVTTVQEDIAYSLFGVFDVRLPVDYGEKKANALGRLLQEIVARSGDITALDWVGQSSEFNSCLPADITSYAAPPCTSPSLSEDEIQTEVSLLQKNTVAVDLASKFYALLKSMSAPRFANRRLHLPCISFRVTEVKQRRCLARETHFIYGVKADGLQDLLITTNERLIQFSRGRPTRHMFFLVRPWDRRLLEQLDFVDDARSAEDLSEPGSQSDDSDEFTGGLPVQEEHHSRALRMMVHLGQPFSAFLLAQQRVGEYKRIASDHTIIAQAKDIASLDNTDVSFMEIL